ncbi:hypothetical protein [Streptomyces sp. NPDC058683]|uniref:hypothetical protein n=1 Tax=Streptomyces sp. NPDC058683 TaxID=3346597 RepID=UPI00364F7546
MADPGRLSLLRARPCACCAPPESWQARRKARVVRYRLVDPGTTELLKNCPTDTG